MTDQRKKTDAIDRDAKRKQAIREDAGPSPLRGLGTFGMVGWSIAVPTVAGALIGLWLDRTQGGAMSWTLALILGGLALGILIAWSFVAKEKIE